MSSSHLARRAGTPELGRFIWFFFVFFCYLFDIYITYYVTVGRFNYINVSLITRLPYIVGGYVDSNSMLCADCKCRISILVRLWFVWHVQNKNMTVWWMLCRFFTLDNNNTSHKGDNINFSYLHNYVLSSDVFDIWMYFPFERLTICPHGSICAAHKWSMLLGRANCFSCASIIYQAVLPRGCRRRAWYYPYVHGSSCLNRVDRWIHLRNMQNVSEGRLTISVSECRRSASL